MKMSTLSPVAIAILLTGCAVGPQYEKPNVQLDSEYLYLADTSPEATNLALNKQAQSKQAKSQQQADYWWQQFNDPVLNQLVRDAQQQSVPLKIAAEQIRMARSYQSAIESFKVPTVNLGAGFANYQLSENDPLLGSAITAVNPINGNKLGLVDDNNSAFFAGASIAWELDLFGRIDSQANAAAIRKEQVVIMREGLTTLITSDVIHNYLQLRGAEERKQIALNTIEDQKQTLRLVEQMVKSGYGSSLDKARAEAMLAATQAVVPQLEIAKNVHKQRLAFLLGETPRQIEQRIAKQSSLPDFDGIIPTGLPSDLLNRRADIRIAEREMAAISEERAAAVASQYPKVFLTGAPGVLAKDFDDLFNSDSISWAASIGISWNVFDGGRGDAIVDMQQARFDMSVLSYEQSVIGAFGEVETLLQGYGYSQQYVERVTYAAEATNIAVDKAKSLYRAGLSDYLSILDAQRQQNAMKDRIVTAKLQTAHLTVGLYKALGGNWQLDSKAQLNSSANP